MENKDINSKNYKVPPKFKPILIGLIKEILINKPKDIINFCVEHFKNEQEKMQNNLNRVTTYPIVITNEKNKNMEANGENIAKINNNCWYVCNNNENASFELNNNNKKIKKK